MAPPASYPVLLGWNAGQSPGVDSYYCHRLRDTKHRLNSADWYYLLRFGQGQRKAHKSPFSDEVLWQLQCLISRGAAFQQLALTAGGEVADREK